MPARSFVRVLGYVLAVGAAMLGGEPRASGEIVVHEYFSPDPAEDLRFGAKTSDGAMAAAIDTKSGPVASPDVSRAAAEGQVAYGAGRSPPGSGGKYKIDRDTSRPETVRYDDPFTPAVAPYKREYAYDAIDERFDLVVKNPALEALPVGGTARAEDDQFYADLEVDLAAAEAVRIPTVGPGARLLAFRVAPHAKLEFFRDGADNWFVRGDLSGRVRLVLHLSIDRAVFGSAFADVPWSRLWPLAPPVPESVREEGIGTARRIGVIDGTGPAEALGILVSHFRGFAPSDDGPESTGLELYRDLAMSKKGVCRHRAYAFVVTALALGIPARFVRNEAHAWVEVFDAARWHRVDLGGAAGRIDFEDEGRVAHVPPRDQFEWPLGSDSGQAMADRSRAGRGAGGTGRARGQGTVGSTSAPAPAPSAAPPPEDERPESSVALRVGGAEARRGGRIRVSGRVESRGSGCGQARVDLFLEAPGANRPSRVALGALVTGEDGRYEGRVVVPFGVLPGDYDVRASTPGNATCGHGESP